MAGHSHWAKIKRAKGANDAKRGKVWSKIARKIIIAAKGGGDPRDNLSLRYTIDEAKAANMPRDTIEKAILKRFPSAKFVSFDRFGDTYGARESDVIRDLPKKLEAYDCDVVISGNAG